MREDLWTDEKCAELTRLWATGISSYEIGLQMGVSKNAIVGKVRRLDLARRRMAPEKPRLGIEFSDLKHDSCVYPMWNDKTDPMHFCGAEITPGRSYCSEHAALCYTPVKKRTPGVPTEPPRYNF